MVYHPAFQPQLTYNWPLGALSCTAFSFAMAGDFDSLGHITPTGKYIRILTGDTVGGTTLQQCDDALRRGYGIDLDTRAGTAALTWDQFAHEINRGKAAILQGGYNAFHGTRYSGSETFQGNHAVTVLPGWVVMDPLADGRRPAIYQYHGEAYPESLVRQFASQLVIDPATGRKSGLRVWCSLTRDNTTTWSVRVHPASREFFVYTVKAGAIVGRVVSRTNGFSASSTPPRFYPWPTSRIKGKSLVQLTSGARKGQWVSSEYATEVP